jgi:hypothetical protein
VRKPGTYCVRCERAHGTVALVSAKIAMGSRGEALQRLGADLAALCYSCLTPEEYARVEEAKPGWIGPCTIVAMR